MQLRIRDLEWWMRRRQLPPPLRLRVRQQERHRWAAARGIDEEALVEDLPEGLRRDIKRHLCLDLLRKVPLFQHFDDLILNNICDRLKPHLFSKGESVSSRIEISKYSNIALTRVQCNSKLILFFWIADHIRRESNPADVLHCEGKPSNRVPTPQQPDKQLHARPWRFLRRWIALLGAPEIGRAVAILQCYVDDVADDGGVQLASEWPEIHQGSLQGQIVQRRGEADHQILLHHMADVGCRHHSACLGSVQASKN